MLLNCFKQNFERLTRHKLSETYSEIDEKLYGSDFAEKIGADIFDYLLRKLICKYFPMHQIQDGYVMVGSVAYKEIYDQYRVSEKNVKEGLAFAFINHEQQMIGRVEDRITAMILKKKSGREEPSEQNSQWILTDSLRNPEPIPIPNLQSSDLRTETLINLSGEGKAATLTKETKESKEGSKIFKDILASYMNATSSSEESEQEKKEQRDTDTALCSFLGELESFEDSEQKHAFEQSIMQLRLLETQPLVKRSPTRPIDFYRKQTPAFFIMPESVEIYISEIQYIKTELNYFHQLMKTNLPIYEIDKRGQYFRAWCTLTFQTPQYYRNPQYKEVSGMHLNSEHAKVQAAKKILMKLYSDNPQRWKEFLMIKHEKKIVC